MKQEAYNLAAYAVEQFVTEMEISEAQEEGPVRRGNAARRRHCVVGSDFKRSARTRRRSVLSSTTARRPSRLEAQVNWRRCRVFLSPCACVISSRLHRGRRDLQEATKVAELNASGIHQPAARTSHSGRSWRIRG